MVIAVLSAPGEKHFSRVQGLIEGNRNSPIREAIDVDSVEEFLIVLGFFPVIAFSPHKLELLGQAKYMEREIPARFLETEERQRDRPGICLLAQYPA